MPRTALFTLLVAFVVTSSLQAQPAGGAFQVNAGRTHFRSGFVGKRGFRSGFFSKPGFSSRRIHLRHDRFGNVLAAYFLPYEEPYRDDATYPGDMTEPVPPVFLAQSDSRAAAVGVQSSVPPIKPQVIELPSTTRSAMMKPLPATVFVLKNGERLEARNFLLTASKLSVTMGRQQRIIPVQMLDIDATISANRGRGIDLQIPVDQHEISLSF